ncbi:hypothetical protein [Providencia rettgeri]|uniref:hypothetical protein n=1 Tax=Providencia rettgeri TaxID=587 RepID=UPI0024BB9B4B|nr:hypothetical protein [Providencia rettgeri]WHT81924.1 hypothetical protein KOL65_22060 [Providencia rettgeri]
MTTIDKILEALGLSSDEITKLDLTDSLIICRVFDAVQEYAMYHDKNPELEKECELFKFKFNQHISSLAQQEISQRKNRGN